MLKYDKMREYMYTKLGCKFFDLFEKDDMLKYVRFQTRKGVNCLLKINRPMSYPSGHSKLVQLVSHDNDDDKDTFDYFVSNDLSMVKKISPSASPQGYINFLNRINPSLESTIYSVAVITSEYLIVDDTHIYHVKDVNLPNTQSQLLIIISLESVVERNVTNESLRVYNHIIDIINETTDKFKTQLKNVLTKCSEMKILSEKVSKLDAVNQVDKNICLSEATKALSLASDALGKLN